jgi:tetratricopeptide (TPR) repeat protein
MGRMAITYLATIYILDVLGQVAEGTRLADRFTAVFRATGEGDPVARFWWHVLVPMRGAYAYDDPWICLEHSRAIRPIHELIGSSQIYLNMHLFLGVSQWYLGAFEPAEQELASIPAADESLGVASSMRRVHLAWLLADRGALDEARVLATGLRDRGVAQKSPLEESRGRWVLAEALRRAGDLDGAERELEAALGMIVPLERPGALATLAALRLAQGRVEEARAVAEDAFSRTAAMGGCGMFRGAFMRLVRAEALHAAGAHDEARAAITEARARLLATAERIHDPAFRTSFLERVPENARTLELAHAWLGDAAPSA